jgi:hypothetical protein
MLAQTARADQLQESAVAMSLTRSALPAKQYPLEAASSRSVPLACGIRACVKANRSAISWKQKRCGRLRGESRPRASPVWGRGGVGT